MEITIEKLKQRGLVEGAKVKGLMGNAWISKYQYDFPENETITKIEEEDGLI